ncbi:hypothetical protein CYMTET_9676 [Cymbomonas tetramitiformis]|uniref:Transcription elongation factor S-II n=1 Tax=Cymbomonas tetramitiformis TaxID=36881 RepID=A0AAE0G993_9CHLO|nr:hypothetical protein CYMTET_17866 [Cymbomonas tetramitiformis]KAK3282598.1 hypothetical protein CYMTET_9676 [Cymbomonas tetramitiformis]|eukprot:gene24692-30053_t
MCDREEVGYLLEEIVKAVKDVDDGGEAQRALDALKRLEKVKMTLDLLKVAEPKLIKKFTKHSNQDISEISARLLKKWKTLAKAEAETAQGKTPAKEDQKPVVKEENPPTPVVRTGDKTRDSLAEKLTDALKQCYEESEDVAGMGDPKSIGASIESELFKKCNKEINKDYRLKFRSLSFNLKDSRNPDLRRKVLSGDIPPAILIALSPEEMASDSAREKNESIRQYFLREMERGGAGSKQASTDQFKCGRCKQRKTTFYQLQTRSADEPMTTFVTCVNCDNRWKFC